MAVGLVGLLIAGACSTGEQAAAPTFSTKEPGVLVVAADLPVPGFWEGDDPTTVDAGYEWGLAEALADRFDLRLDVIDRPFDRIVRGDLGSADVGIAQVSITEARREDVDFSISYFASSPTVVTRADDLDDLVDLATAQEQEWAVQRGTTEADLIVDVVRPDDEPVYADDETAATRLVADGAADAALIDLPTALVIVGQEPDLAVRSRFDEEEHYGVVLPRDSDNTRVLDQAIRTLRADETLLHLRERWLDPVFAEDPDSIPVISFSD